MDDNVSPSTKALWCVVFAAYTSIELLSRQIAISQGIAGLNMQPIEPGLFLDSIERILPDYAPDGPDRAYLNSQISGLRSAMALL